MISENPGDGGAKAVNTLVGYARACGIVLEFDGHQPAIPGGVSDSVLPVVPRRAEPDRRARVRSLVQDAAFGTVIGVSVMYLLT